MVQVFVTRDKKPALTEVGTKLPILIPSCPSEVVSVLYDLTKMISNKT